MTEQKTLDALTSTEHYIEGAGSSYTIMFAALAIRAVVYALLTIATDVCRVCRVRENR